MLGLLRSQAKAGVQLQTAGLLFLLLLLSVSYFNNFSYLF